jgi:hypothetical protein
MYDRSESMLTMPPKSGPVWDLCKAGLENFFAAPSSAGIHASLTFFGATTGDQCSVSSYTTPNVPMEAPF